MLSRRLKVWKPMILNNTEYPSSAVMFHAQYNDLALFGQFGLDMYCLLLMAARNFPPHFASDESRYLVYISTNTSKTVVRNPFLLAPL